MPLRKPLKLYIYIYILRVLVRIKSGKCVLAAAGILTHFLALFGSYSDSCICLEYLLLYPTAHKTEMMFLLTFYDPLPLMCFIGDQFLIPPRRHPPPSNYATWADSWPCSLAHRWILTTSQRTSQWRTWWNHRQAASMWPRKESMPWWKRIHCLALCALSFIRN